MMDLLCVFVEIVCPDLARATKDIIKLKANLEGYFDAGTDIIHDLSAFHLQVASLSRFIINSLCFSWSL